MSMSKTAMTNFSRQLPFPATLQAVEAVPASCSCIRIADFGTADGGTSMPLLNSLVDLIHS